MDQAEYKTTTTAEVVPFPIASPRAAASAAGEDPPVLLPGPVWRRLIDAAQVLADLDRRRVVR